MEIEEGIPIPPIKERDWELVEVAEKMKVGDRVVFRTDEVQRVERLRRIMVDLGFKVTRRKIRRGYGLWRIE